MTISHKLVIVLPDECELDTTGGTITMTVEQAREWAQSVLDATPRGAITRERVDTWGSQPISDTPEGGRRDIHPRWTVRQPAGYAPLEVDEATAELSGQFRKR